MVHHWARLPLLRPEECFSSRAAAALSGSVFQKADFGGGWAARMSLFSPVGQNPMDAQPDAHTT